ncbi:MAG: AbrB/MazE/SpoVT family DNA-binding domain-containing protein [Candidatus Hodarchaeales archaeon]
MTLDGLVKVTNRGMITIPANLRKKYGLKDGDRVIVIEDEGMLRIVPVESIESLQNRALTTKEMMEILKRSREEELELEDK